MRQIKFRGKANDGRWVYGSLVYTEEFQTAIYFQVGKRLDWAYVDPATVGQFTGLFDKNGTPIYEGDILREPPKNEYDKENYVAFEVFWHDNDCASHHIGWQMNRCHFQGCICGIMYMSEFLPKTTARMEVIGNVFDNKDLLE